MEFPQVDLPVDMIAWTEVTEDILNIYKQSCRLKACIFALCIEGSITVSINLMDTEINKGDFITLLPGTIIQFYEQKEKSVPGIRGVFFPLPQWSQPHPVYIELLLQHTGVSGTGCQPYRRLLFQGLFCLMGTHHDRSLSSRYKNGSKHIELAPQRHRQNVLPPSADAKREQEPERGNMPRTGAARHRKLYPRTPRAILCRQTGHLPATPQHHREAGDRQKCIGHHRPRRHRRRESQAEINQHDHSGDCLFPELPQCFLLWKILQEAHGHESAGV